MDGQKSDLKTFFLGLEPAAQERFAVRAGTTVGYLRAHLIRGSRVPRPELMESLAEACREFGAGLSKEDLLAFFYSRTEAGQGAQNAESPLPSG